MTRLSRGVALVAGLVTTATVAGAGTLPAGLAVVGTAAMVVGATRERQGAVDLGGLVVVLGILVAGTRGVPADLLVLATVGAVLAWDSAGHALGLSVQLGPDATTRRGEAVHVGVTLVAAAGVAALAMLTFVVGDGRVPLVAGVVVAIGAVLVAGGLVPGTD